MQSVETEHWVMVTSAAAGGKRVYDVFWLTGTSSATFATGAECGDDVTWRRRQATHLSICTGANTNQRHEIHAFSSRGSFTAALQGPSHAYFQR